MAVGVISKANNSNIMFNRTVELSALVLVSTWLLAGITGALIFRQTSSMNKQIRSIEAEDEEDDEGDDYDDDEDGEDELEDEEEDDDFDPSLITDEYTSTDSPFKLLLCVNTSLQMGKGKIAAQCGHATLGAYRIARAYCPSAIRWWHRTGQAKIAVKIDNDTSMLDLQSKARALGLVSYIVEDAGRTQIAAGSKTVLAIGPAPVTLIDTITKSLKLL